MCVALNLVLLYVHVRNILPYQPCTPPPSVAVPNYGNLGQGLKDSEGEDEDQQGGDDDGGGADKEDDNS